MSPSEPPLGKLRIASPADILRLGIVCTAGFYYSDQFQWVWCYHADFPLDTITFFRNEIESLMKNPEYIVLVAVDAYDPGESKHTSATIPADNGWEPPAAGETVVVGLAVWKVEPNSTRYGLYHNEAASSADLRECLHRDEDFERAKNLGAAIEEIELEHFQGISVMERTVIHPAYWRRGHGSALTKWGTDLADIDEVDQGVATTSIGALLFRKMGFEEVVTVHIDGDEKDPKGLSVEVLKYTSR